MASDFDEPSKDDDEDSLEELQARRLDPKSGSIDADETEQVETLELPGSDLSEHLAVEILPQQPDEFVCSSCFLVHHLSQLDHHRGSGPVCTDCS